MPYILAYKPTLKLYKKIIKLEAGLYAYKSDLTQTKCHGATSEIRNITDITIQSYIQR